MEGFEQGAVIDEGGFDLSCAGSAMGCTDLDVRDDGKGKTSVEFPEQETYVAMLVCLGEMVRRRSRFLSLSFRSLQI